MNPIDSALRGQLTNEQWIAARLLCSHSQSISQSLSQITASERSRRVLYRSKFSGKLPWEVRGLGAGTEDVALPFDAEFKYGIEDLPELRHDELESE